ncbi:MAG: peptidoglycan-binding protein [Coriobacteriales bacterium]|jgi:peptidoglycan hydrolase-like protein with peptidoglycan-binding domain|nr:peptidoglycan-binding protein [Coriobacteriales bacterium]
METIGLGATGLAVRDVQQRLQALGFELADEVERNSYGAATAAAVSAFRVQAQLPLGDTVDSQAWAALVDATFTLGDRVLYLRMPYFHGRDVATLQTALSILGFSCGADGIFGAHTEHAAREFQSNVGIEPDGIVGDSTFSAIKRLHHAWRGKETLAVESRSLGLARVAEVLEKTGICVSGTDELTRSIARRISNLATATTPLSKVVSAPSLAAAPQQTLLMVHIVRAPYELDDGVPLVYFDSDATLGTRMRTAIESSGGAQPHILVELALEPANGMNFSGYEEQHCAIALLDALCLAFA